jgi:hypothetical protein
MSRCFFRHTYKPITPSFMHLFVAKELGETPSAVPMIAGRECMHCGKREIIMLHETIPEIIVQRAQQWQRKELESLENGDQLMLVLSTNKTLFVKELEAHMITEMLEKAGLTGLVVFPRTFSDADLDAEIEAKKANLQLVVNNNT